MKSESSYVVQIWKWIRLRNPIQFSQLGDATSNARILNTSTMAGAGFLCRKGNCFFIEGGQLWKAVGKDVPSKKEWDVVAFRGIK